MIEKLEKLEKLKKLFDDGILSEQEYSDLKEKVISPIKPVSEVRTENTQPINCSSCGAVNQLAEGRTSLFCSFCGNTVQLKKVIQTDGNSITSNSNNNNPIISKPHISERKFEMVPGNIGIFGLGTDYDNNRRRVDGGFEYWDRNRWVFCADKEIIVDEGGELSLVNRNISSLNQITQWFSDSELGDVTSLVLEKNNINSLVGIESFKNLRELVLSFNKINDISNSNIAHIGAVILKGNPIEINDSAKNSLPDNITFNNELFCEECGYHMTEKMVKVNGDICSNCNNIKEYKNRVRLDINEMASKLAGPPPGFLKLFAREMGGNCFIATATMGSYDHPVVVELRLFRDNWILKRTWGKGFVNWYYHYGAIAAKVIEKSLILKKLSYFIIVKPLYIISKAIKKQ